MNTSTSSPVLALDAVGLRRDGRTILVDVSWAVRPGEHWAVLGANGSGKTTLVRVAALVLHPSTGTVDLLGERLGRGDARSLRARVALTGAGMAERLRPNLVACDIVMTALHGALEPWWHTYSAHDRARAINCLARFGLDALADQTFATMSSGERQRVLLARALMTEPELVLLDEPTAGLDLAGREGLVDSLDRLARSGGAPMVLVTHHLEEIPAAFSHVLLLREGRVLDQGPIESVLTHDAVSVCFGVALSVHRRAGRWSAITRPGSRPADQRSQSGT